MRSADPDVIRERAVQAGRCLRIPPRGEQEEAAEEGEDAGAYLNVVLPAATRLSHGDAWSGESMSGAREGASSARAPGRLDAGSGGRGASARRARPPCWSPL